MKDNYFFYVGNAYPHKNLDRLIEAILLLNTKYEQIYKLKIVSGKNAFYDKLLNSIKKHKAESCVDLLGYVDDDELNNLYKNSIAFVFPTLSEGFGLPGLEAINSGTLLLASNIPVLKEVYDSHAIYFNPADVKSIASAMENAIGMGLKERENIIKSAKVFAKRYSWAKMAEQTLKIYEDTIKNSNSLRSG